MLATSTLMEIGSSEVALISKFRWVLSAEFPFGKVPETFIGFKSQSFEESEHKQITTTLFDCDKNDFKPIWDVCSPFYEDFWKELKSGTPEYLGKLQSFMGTIFITMYSGIGELLQKYTFYGTYPISMDFVELDHSNSNETTIEIIWSYEYFESTDTTSV